MWIVALALRRPYTFVVMALVIILLMPVVLIRTPVDIFPDINIPVISVVWNYAGFAPTEMASRIITNSERGITITVNDIEHIESQSVYGIGVIKIFFRPQANIQNRAGASHSDGANHCAIASAGNDSASSHYLFRIFHSNCATRAEQQDHAGAGTF